MKDIQLKLQKHFDEKMAAGFLFKVNVNKKRFEDKNGKLKKAKHDIFENIYLDYFHEDPIFRKEVVHDCAMCRSWFTKYSEVVSIDSDGNIVSLFDLELEESDEYYSSFKALSEVIRSGKIEGIFMETFNRLSSYKSWGHTPSKHDLVFKTGMKNNRCDKDHITIFNHFYLEIPSKFVDISGLDQDTVRSWYNKGYQDLKKTMNLSKDLWTKAIENVDKILDSAHNKKILEFYRDLKDLYDLSTKKENFLWVHAAKRVFEYKKNPENLYNDFKGFTSTALGVFVETGSTALFNTIKDSANDGRTTAPISAKQLETAEEFLVKNDYVDSFTERSFATIGDIPINEIEHQHNQKVQKLTMMKNIVPKAESAEKKDFTGIPEMSIEEFLADVLPGVTELKAYVEDAHRGNFGALITNRTNTKPIFNYGNPFSFTSISGGSRKTELREQVKEQGGQLGFMGVTLAWSEEDSRDNSDLDLHVITPDGFEIYHGGLVDSRTGGALDLDVRYPESHKQALIRSGKKPICLENTRFLDSKKLIDGEYKVFVVNYDAKQSEGFTLNLYFGDSEYFYKYPMAVGHKKKIQVATITKSKDVFSIKHAFDPIAQEASTQVPSVWGIALNSFHHVNLVSLSPNYWGESPTGVKQYLFMLKGCKPDIELKGFHTNDLRGELLPYKRQLTAYAEANKVKPSLDEDQLAGLSFSTGMIIPMELVVKADNRLIKLKI